MIVDSREEFVELVLVVVFLIPAFLTVPEFKIEASTTGVSVVVVFVLLGVAVVV